MDPKMIEMNNLRVLNDYLNQTIDILARQPRFGHAGAPGYGFSPFAPVPTAGTVGTDTVYGPWHATAMAAHYAPFGASQYPMFPVYGASPAFGGVDPLLSQRSFAQSTFAQPAYAPVGQASMSYGPMSYGPSFAWPQSFAAQSFAPQSLGSSFAWPQSLAPQSYAQGIGPSFAWPQSFGPSLAWPQSFVPQSFAPASYAQSFGPSYSQGFGFGPASYGWGPAYGWQQQGITPAAEVQRQTQISQALYARQSVLEAMCRAYGIPV